MFQLLQELLLILVLVLLNGVFALSEIAVVSARTTRLQELARRGDRRAGRALDLARRPGPFLSTVQVGITLVGVFSGALGEATLAVKLAEAVSGLPVIGPYSGTFALVLVVLGITFLFLILGELVPKRLALRDPERLASVVAGPMSSLASLARPVVWFLDRSSELVLRLSQAPPGDRSPITEQEIQLLLRQGAEAGAFEPEETEMVEGIFRLADRRISSIMTNRTEIVWLDISDTPADLARKIAQSRHSRFPVCEGDLDRILGFVRARELLADCMDGHPIDLRRHLAEVPIIPESMLALDVLELSKKAGAHLAMVMNEYGGVEGLVTTIDLLEAIVGELPTRGEAMQTPARERGDGSWVINGLLPVQEFRALFGIGPLPGETRGTFETVGGFAMMHLGRIPSEGDQFEWGGLVFEVLDMDGLRVDKLLVMREPKDGSRE